MYFFYIDKMYPIARPRNGKQQLIVKFKTDSFKETVGQRQKKNKKWKSKNKITTKEMNQLEMPV